MVFEARPDLARAGGAYRRTVDEQRSGDKSLGQPVRAEQNFGHLRRVGHAGDDHLTGARHLTRAVGLDCSERQERSRPARRAVPHRERESCPCQVGRHGSTHRPQADETHL